MVFETKNVTLKDGGAAIFRSPERTDAKEMLEYLLEISTETHFILRYPEECDMSEEQEADFLEAINKSEYGVMIVCQVNGEVAGNCHLSFNRRIKTKHRASVAIALRKKYWNLGIGTLMFKEMIAFAKTRGVTQLELEYIEGNQRAQRLYEKIGFRAVAERPDAIRLKDGTLLKEVIMTMKL